MLRRIQTPRVFRGRRIWGKGMGVRDRMLRLRRRIVRGVPDGRVPARSSAVHCGKIEHAALTAERCNAEA
jgi:hypothetical protein